MSAGTAAGRRTVRAACPHDCPDTCAMLVTVDEEGRAVGVAGNPDQPVTAGFLCGKVSNYLDRVYAPDRLLHPLVRTGAKGDGAFRRASWEEALDRIAEGLTGAIERHGGASILPYSYMGTQGLLQGDVMSARVMHALGATELVRTICATAGLAGTTAAEGVSPEVDPELWPHARFLLLWGWNPLSTAPHLWRLLLEARRAGARLVVVDPFRSRTARLADEHLAPVPGTDGALALGMMRAIVDAGVHDDDWCRAHADGYEDLLDRVGEQPVEGWAQRCGIDPAVIRRVGVGFATSQPALLRAGVGAQRHAGAPAAYATLACLPALAGSWRHRGGGFSYIPTATAGAVSNAALRRADLRPGEGRSINMAQLGDALTDPDLAPPVAAVVCWNANPAQIAPDQTRVLAGLAREDLFLLVLEQFATDTARFADVVLPATTALEHLDVVFSWGHHHVTFNEPAIAPRGEAVPNTEAFRRIAARMDLRDPCFADRDEDLARQLLDSRPAGIGLVELRTRGFAKVELGQGERPHADGGFGTPSGRIDLGAAGYEPPAEVTDDALGRRFGLALLTPKTHLFLNSTFANQERQHRAQPRPYVLLHPADARERRISDGDTVRVFNDRGAFRCQARVADDVRRGVAVAPMGWWARDHLGGLGAQATTAQRLTSRGAAPTFNDNRVEVVPA